MKVRETDLPGVGRKYVLETEKGAEIIIVIHNTGKREMCILQDKEKEEEPACIIQLTDDEAKEVAFLLAGTRYQTAPADKLEFLTREVVMEWLKVQENSKLSGKTIADNQIRRKTGVSVIAIIRDNRIIPSPDPTQKIEAGDTIVVVGTREQIKNFIEIFGGLKPE